MRLRQLRGEEVEEVAVHVEEERELVTSQQLSLRLVSQRMSRQIARASAWSTSELSKGMLGQMPFQWREKIAIYTDIREERRYTAAGQ